jgi:hypothetical protein
MNGAWFPLTLTGLLAAAPVIAVEYLGVESAQKLAYPDATSFAPLPLALGDDARANLAAVARPPGARDPKVWRALAGTRVLGTFFVDAVIGKQDYIVYALALDPQGRVLRLEVLEYRETHGWEIRNERWRAQFTGKSAADALQIGQDIANISGATLSCRHVTDGVRRLVALHALLPAS